MITIRSSDTYLDWQCEGNRRIRQNVLNILRMWQGEAAFERPMGVNREALYKPLPAASSYLCTQVRENIEAYEPDASISDVRVVGGGAGEIVIEVDLDE